MTLPPPSHLIGWLANRLGHVITCVLLFSILTALLTSRQRTEFIGHPHIKTSTNMNPSQKWTGLGRHDTDIDCYQGYTGSNITDDVMRNRSSHVIKICTSAGLTGHRRLIDAPMFKNILVNDELKMIYCHVPHVASATWMKTFVYARGIPPRSYDLYKASYLAAFGFRKLGDYGIEDITMKLNSYFKFVFIRDPIERIVSAYKYLFNSKIKSHHNEIYRKRLARHMARKFPGASALLEKSGQINFTDYVTFIAEATKTKVPLDSHVSRISQLCLPCLIKYNAIGKLDTFRDDATFILRKFYNNSCYETLRSDSFTNALPRTTKKEVEELFKNVSSDVQQILESHFSFEKKLFDF